MFSLEDKELLKIKGISEAKIEKQIDYFKKGTQFVKLEKAASIDDGIIVINDKLAEKYLEIYRTYIRDNEGKVLKFVPASGAASRMFKDLLTALNDNSENAYKEQNVKYFFKNIKNFAFYLDLEELLTEENLSLDQLLNERNYKTILEWLLLKEGLNYKNQPKALIPFHNYDDFYCTAIEEHLVEGAHYARAENGTTHIHFTLSEEHIPDVNELLDDIQSHFEDLYDVTYDITFSKQKSSTDSIALNKDFTPFKDEEGNLLFRPAGHGALIENLNEIDAELVFIKNIDNVSKLRVNHDSFRHQKLMAGCLISIQKKIFKHLRELKANRSDLYEVEKFVSEFLNIKLPYLFESKSQEERKSFLIAKLDRPLRVCGMVKNSGDKGGGPFWVKNNDGSCSLQIIEGAQINTKDNAQLEILNNSTHFNPVDIVCSFVDFEGNLFDLKDYIDNEAYFISEKSHNGKDLLALELPGLWNGSMADWNTIFMEIPASIFTPVKSVNDLLLEAHQ